MIIEIIILSAISMLIIFLRTGKFDISNIAIDIKGYKLFIIMAVIQITAVFLFKIYNNNEIFKILSMNWLIYPVLLYVTLINFKKNYMKLFFIGTLLNFIAIAFNDFKMPVFIAETYANSQNTILFLKSNQDLIHSIATDSTRFKILCDIITLPPPYPFAKTISIGDIFLLSGIFIFWQYALKSDSQNTN
nr:DUF5317 domain-containing protein [Sedimentibacter sp.]